MTIDRVNDWCFVGATVSMERWDSTLGNRSARMGLSRVVSIKEDCCESGYMVTVESGNRSQELDLHWLAPPGTVWTTCKNPNCRGRRNGGDRWSAHCLPGQESTAQCNECFSR